MTVSSTGATDSNIRPLLAVCSESDPEVTEFTEEIEKVLGCPRYSVSPKHYCNLRARIDSIREEYIGSPRFQWATEELERRIKHEEAELQDALDYPQYCYEVLDLSLVQEGITKIATAAILCSLTMGCVVFSYWKS